MDHMEIVDVINNLKKWESWDYKCYPLSKAEAESIIKFFDIVKRAYNGWRIMGCPDKVHFECDGTESEIDYSVIEEGINGLDCD